MTELFFLFSMVGKKQSFPCSKFWVREMYYFVHERESKVWKNAMCGLSVCLLDPLLSVGPDSPSSRATNLRRSSVTKLVLKLMRHVNILRQGVCIRPLTGFMFSCNLCLVSRGNSLRPRSWFMVIYGGRCEAWRLYWPDRLIPPGLGRGRIKTRCGDTFWKHTNKIWYGTVADNLTLCDLSGNSSSDT